MSISGCKSGQGRELILVVEDSPTQAEQLRYILEKHDYRVSTAGNARTALAMIGELKPALVISDIMMPEMNGYELCRRIKALEECRDIPVVLLTSLSDTQDVIRALECGADNFFTKPYNEAYLLSRVTDMLENRAREPEHTTLPGLEISFASQKYAITSDHRQILNLLLSTYETAILKNRELAQAQDELREINEQLEKRVRERTAELATAIDLLRVETAERLQAMEELRQKERLMMQQSRQAAMGEMIGNIAHQWRQPLNTLGLYIQRLELFYESGDFTKELLATTTSDSMQVINHMSRTIDDFSNFFKPEKEKTTFDVNQVIRKTVTLVKDSLKSQMIGIEILAEGAPLVHGYPNEYSQVILNILMNARDVLSERRIGNARITVKSFTEDGRSVVTISDNAGGIAENVMERIFDPYFTTKGPDKGTGIGLNMAKSIIETNMNGTLTARNTVEGAEFRIEV
jgi:signal transduction histidine kinase